MISLRQFALMGLVLRPLLLGAAVSVSGSGDLIVFDTLPSSNDWTTVSIPGGNGSVVDAAQLNAVVQTNNSVRISSPLVTSANAPPSSMALAQWSTPGRYLQTRPAGNACTLLMVRLRNETPTNLALLRVAYDFAVSFPTTETIPGHRLYWSLAGTPNSWQFLMQVSNSGPVSLDIPVQNWPPGALSYLLWADDRGPVSPDSAAAIDNFVATPPQGPKVIMNPAGGQSYPRGRPIPVVASAQLAGPVTNVVFFDGATPFDADTTIPFSTQLTNGALGSHDLMAVARDTLGNVVTSAVSRITVVPNQPPQIQFPFLSDGDAFGVGVYLVPQVAAVDPDGVVAAIELSIQGLGQLSNAVSSTTFGLPDLPVGRQQLSAVAIDLEGNRGTNTISVLVTNPLEYAFLVTNTAPWRYLNDGTDQGTAWRTPSFVDTAWPVGHGLFGSASPLLARKTLLAAGPGTAYFRHHFQVSSPAAFTNLFVQVIPGDGDILYLNGVEVFRLNLPTGPVTWQTAPTAFGHGQYFVGTNIHPALLVAGDNVLAAEVHSGSSDRVFDAMLWAQPGDPPPLSLTRGSAGTIRVSWPAWAPDYRLQSRTNLGAGEWQDVTQAPSGDGLVWQTTIETTTAPASFFRLQRR